MHDLNPFDPTSPMLDGMDPYGDFSKEDADRLFHDAVVRLLSFFGMMVLALAIAAIISLLSSCGTTQKTEHQQHTHVTQTDSAGTEHSNAGQVADRSVNVDSIVTAILQRTREEFARQEQEHEITTETLTETIDSLGRVVRQSQKTTDRTLSRQEQQRIERLEQTFEQQIHRAIQEHDSLWQDRFSQYQSSMRDSLATIRDRQLQRTVSSPVTIWQQIQQWFGRLAMLALAVLAAIWALKKRGLWRRR